MVEYYLAGDGASCSMKAQMPSGYSLQEKICTPGKTAKSISGCPNKLGRKEMF